MGLKCIDSTGRDSQGVEFDALCHSRDTERCTRRHDFVATLDYDRDDLEAFCVDQVEAGLAIYTSSSNGNPPVYDTVRCTKVWADACIVSLR